MKNKLLLSSALVGGLIASGSSFAQTSVSGNISLNYKAQAHKATSATAKSERFFGRETQLNIANKGKRAWLTNCKSKVISPIENLP
jgi:hypothetical protein